MKTILFLLLFFPFVAAAQNAATTDPWTIFKPFIGKWTGEGSVESGKGSYVRSYQLIMNNNFLEVRNKTSYPPSTNNPKGEVHEDLGYFSYDRSLKTFRLRQFHIEGFVNEYLLDSISTDQKTLVFVTKSIENIPAGWRAKETYKILSDSQIEETFELAAPGKDYEVYSKALLIKTK